MSEMIQNRLDRAFFRYQDEFEQKALEVLRSGWYLLGKETSEFEKEFAAFVGTKNCVGVANGSDALWIALMVLGIGAGDEVIVPANAFVADVMAVVRCGALPVLAEPDEYFCLSPEAFEKKITAKTKAMIPVHLYGQSCDMDALTAIAHSRGIRVIEDCAQSHGAMYNGRVTGSFGDISCFSFYPTKNLGAFGDGGAILTNSDELAAQVREFRYYGSRERYHYGTVGTNSRLDEMQAGLLRVRLSHFGEILAERRAIAETYLHEIKNENIMLPLVREGAVHTWHQFVIRCDERDKLAAFLAEKGIRTLIHYPVPVHLTEAYAFLDIKKGELPLTEHYADTMLSLPIYNGITAEELDRVTAAVNEFLK